MTDDRSKRLDAIERYNRMLEKQTGVAVRPFRKDGYVNLINRYGTEKDSSEHYHFVPEPEYPDELLTAFYEGNGLFAKIIDTPAEEAVKHGFELDDVKDAKLIDFYEEALDELDWEETAMTAVKWSRLFGGSIAVMLINDGRGLEEPLNWRDIQSIDDIRVFDRSLIQPNYESMYQYNSQDPFRTRGSRLGYPETYQIFSRYGNFTVHESRCLIFKNGVLPENTRSEQYRIWGIPEYVRINKAVRDAEVAHRNAPKLLERSVQAIYKMKDLSQLLATNQGEDVLLRRLQAIDLARGLLNSIAIDNEGEDYDFKTFQFSGINDVISASCNLLSAVSHIPQAILFGSSVGGLSSTDDTAMENWYNYVESIRKEQLRSNLRYLLSVIFQAGTHTGEVDEVPKLKVKFKPLWSLSDAEQADLDQKKAQTQLTKAQTAQAYVDMQAIDASEVRSKLADSEEFDVENMLDEMETDEDIFGESIPEGLDYLSDGDKQKALQEYGSEARPEEGGQHLLNEGMLREAAAEAKAQGKDYGFGDYQEGVSLEEHNVDPGTEGSVSTAAPAATKLPQDMSEEEHQKAQIAQENKDDEESISNTEPEKIGGVGVLCVKDGAFLAAQRKTGQCVGTICGPGGHIEYGETPEQAAIRETQEEFGITPKELIQVGYGPEETGTGYSPAIFLCTEWEGEAHPTDGEMGEAMCMSPKMIEELRPILFSPFADSVDVLINTVSAPNNRNDSAYDEWLEENLDKFPDEDDEIAFAKWNGEEGKTPRQAESVEEVEKAWAAYKRSRTDGGPGSGNFNHGGRPGEVGGSLPSSSAANKRMKDAYNYKEKGEDYVLVSREFRKIIHDAPPGTKITIGNTTYTKNGEGKYEYDRNGKSWTTVENALANSIDCFDESKCPTFEMPDAEEVAEEKVEAGTLAPEETSVKVEPQTAQTVTKEQMKELGVNDPQIAADRFGELAKNRGDTDKPLTSEEYTGMVESLRYYVQGSGANDKEILYTQDPETYGETLPETMSEEKFAECSRKAQQIEDFIAAADKVDKPVYRGMSFNSSIFEEDTIQGVLETLHPGADVSFGHLASWSTSRYTAESYAGSAVDMELEEGENYSIVYILDKPKSIASLRGINPEGECLSPKSAKFVVESVDYDFDEDLVEHRYRVHVKEV